jgi:hypothetical protein
MEIADPTNDPVFDGPTPEELLQQFVDCMTEDQWIGSEMPEVARQSTLYHTSCASASCHKYGLGNNWMKLPEDLSEPKAFDMMKNTLNVLSLARPEVIPTSDGKQKAIMVQSCRYIDKGVKGAGTNEHDPYTLSPDHRDRLDNWFRAVTLACFGEASPSTCL